MHTQYNIHGEVTQTRNADHTGRFTVKELWLCWLFAIRPLFSNRPKFFCHGGGYGVL
jgi:hypothetical protein